MPSTSLQHEWVRRVLGVAGDELPPNATPDIRRWTAARVGWFNAIDTVNARLEALVDSMRESSDPEYQEIAANGLGRVTADFPQTLFAAIQAIDRSGGSPDASALNALRKTVGDLIDYLTSDGAAAAVDANELGWKVDAIDTLIPALDALEDVAAQWEA